jgi:selenocysteine lyase/cysteine desulfurase
MQTEFAFTLPRGFRDDAGTVHREGIMRLATARDEIEPMRDAEVRANEAYLTVLLVEELYAADFDHLQRLYERINTDGELVGVVACPDCGREFEADLSEIQDAPPGK